MAKRAAPAATNPGVPHAIQLAVPRSRGMMSEIGTTGLRHTGGYLTEEFLRQLAGRRAVQVYREMANNDATIGAALLAIKSLIRQTTWTMEAADETNKAQQIADFVQSCMDDMSHSWQDYLSNVLSMLEYGWSWHETVYKRRNGPDGDPASKYVDGLIGWRKIPIRSQDTLQRWEMDPEGGILGMWQQDFSAGRAQVLIPIEKSLLFRPEAYKNSPEGRSILRNAYREWFFKKRVEEVEGIGIERDLAGVPVMYAPSQIMDPNASDTDKAIFAALKKAVTAIRRDEHEGMILPSNRDDKGNALYDFKLVSSAGQRQFDTSRIIDRRDARILMSMLCDFIMLGTKAVGSFALSSDKTELFAVALGGWMDAIAGVHNRHAIPRLIRLNGMPAELAPKLVHGDVEKQELEKIGGFIERLSRAGMPLFPDPALEEHLRELGGLPPPDEDALRDVEGGTGRDDEDQPGAGPGRDEPDAAGRGGEESDTP